MRAAPPAVDTGVAPFSSIRGPSVAGDKCKLHIRLIPGKTDFVSGGVAKWQQVGVGASGETAISSPEARGPRRGLTGEDLPVCRLLRAPTALDVDHVIRLDGRDLEETAVQLTGHNDVE